MRAESELRGAAQPTRERQRAETRNLILAVALEEIASSGLAGARIGHIARRAGVTRPTIYAHFPAKEDFLRELQARSERSALHALQSRLDSTADHGTGAGLLQRLVDAVFDLVAEANPVLRREVFALIVRESPRADWSGNPLFGFLTSQLAMAQQRAEVTAELPAVELTRIVMTALFGFLIVEAEPEDERRRAAQRMLELLVRPAAA